MNSIQLFDKVRDIPYRIPINSNEEDFCCNGKARRLRKLLEQEGLQARYVVCSFRWSDLDIPKKILNLTDDDFSTHVYLEVLIANRWIKIDPTWDAGLKDILPISEWDGETDTTLAVSPIETYSIEKSEEIMSHCEPEQVAVDRNDKNHDFEEALNSWLEQNRT